MFEGKQGPDDEFYRQRAAAGFSVPPGRDHNAPKNAGCAAIATPLRKQNRCNDPSIGAPADNLHARPSRRSDDRERRAEAGHFLAHPTIAENVRQKEIKKWKHGKYRFFTERVKRQK